jgi:muramoyltetrapeptide carboxypeptidase
MLQKPRPLTKTSHVAVLAASSPSELPRIEVAAERLRSRGLRVTLAPNVAHRDRYLAGGDDERVGIVNDFLRSAEFDGFFFARGGYGLMRILDRIDYDAITANPRPIVGFSDLTALHQAIAVRCGVGTFHGPMLNSDWHDGLSPDREAWFWSMLAGEAPLSWPFGDEQVLNEGEAEGVLFGGCLSLINDLAGTPYDFWIDDGIWFWEDIDEPVYRIDRMLTHLRLTGRLKKIRGVIIGKLRGCGSDAEITAFLREFFGSMSIPVVRDFPFGHEGDNLMMPIGVRARLSTKNSVFSITEPAVSLG